MKDSPYLDAAMVAVYDRIAAPFQFSAPANDLVKIAALNEGDVVLDVGTGTGVVASAAIASVGLAGMVIGVDSAPQMMECARKKASCLVLAGVPGLPFASDCFDAVLAGFVVSHFENYEDGLKDMVRVCRIDGRVAMSAWGSAPNPAAALWNEIAGEYVPREELNDAFLRHIPWDTWFSTIENVTAALQAAGLSSLRTETRFYTIRMQTADYLLSREASMQGLILRRKLTSAQWADFSMTASKAFQSKFGDSVEYERDVCFGIGTKQ